MAAMQRNDLLAGLPQSWRRRLSGYRFQSVNRGMSDALTFRLRSAAGQTLYLKAAAPDALPQLRDEIERTRWLAARNVHVPDILDFFDDSRLSVALMTALPGSHPHEAALPAGDIIASLARGLRALHALAAADCPFDETITARLDRARAAIEAGDVDAGEFDARNLGRSPLEIYRQLAAQAPRIEQDIVLVHGDATFDNLLIDASGNLGFIDCGHAGRGDRTLDLQTIASDIEDHFGPEWIEPFARDYAIGLDRTKLRFFDDLYELF
jgi:aminoglycoside 3'-phosphotransferase II